MRQHGRMPQFSGSAANGLDAVPTKSYSGDLDSCKICGGSTAEFGTKIGAFRRQSFHFRRCPACGFVFVSNPIAAYTEIYNEDYFSGRGADPFVDYVFELEHPESTIRVYEWEGVLRAVRSLVEVSKSTHWLDFSCGNGGLVRYCREKERCQIEGYEEGPIRRKAEQLGIPLISKKDLEALEGTYDIVTAIEVLEHLPEPLESLRVIRRLLRPGGLFFYTTGNVAPQRNRFLNWRYVYPEVHISYFEPRTLHRALVDSGFEPESAGYIPGFREIIRFKALKSLGARKRALWERCLPWGVLARLTDWKLGVTHHPIGWVGKSRGLPLQS